MVKIGEMTCKEMMCACCPFQSMPKGFCLDFNSKLTLNEGFEKFKRFLSDYQQEKIKKVLNKPYKVLEVKLEEGNETNNE